MDLHYRKIGTGTPLIVLHGLFGSGDNWLPVARGLKDACTCYLLDLRNHGRSPHHPDISHDAMAADVVEFIHTHRLKRPVILGHSMGGKVAMKLGFKHPELVCALVIVDIIPRRYTLDFNRLLNGMLHVDLHSLRSLEEIDRALTPYIPGHLFRYFIMKNIRQDEYHNYYWQLNIKGLTDSIQILGTSPAEPDSRYVGPVLFIEGAKSNFVTEGDHQLLSRHLPQVTITSIQDAGHWVQADRPREVISEIKNFITGLPTHDT